MTKSAAPWSPSSLEECRSFRWSARMRWSSCCAGQRCSPKLRSPLEMTMTTKLAGYVFEAMRFDPLRPRSHADADKALYSRRRNFTREGTSQGMAVLVSFASAMMDGRRIRDPEAFIPDRPACNYIHFGHGLHECFGIHINRGLLPAILKPLLKRNNLAGSGCRRPSPKTRCIR